MTAIPVIISEQRAFFKTQKTRDINFIKSTLKDLKSEIKQNEDAICNALIADFKKPVFETFVNEIGVVAAEIDLAIKNVKKWSKTKRVIPSMLSFPSSDYIYSEPYGTVLIIAPWNYPFQLTFAPIIAAIAAGNTVVLKPSELTPNISKVIEDIINKVFNKSHLAVVQGSIPETTALLAERWDYIFFTGSVPVGKIVAQAAAKHLTPVTLELGGKSPCIIDETVNTKLVAKRLVWGKFMNAGQTCIAPDYFLVEKSVKATLINDIKQAITKAYGENPELSQDYPRIVNSRNLDRLAKMLEGVNVVHGGEVNKTDNYLAPTIIDEPGLDSEVMKDEIFGPIIPILAYTDEADIDRIISNYDKPLAFYVFSNKKSFTKRLMKKYSFGGGTINDTLIHFSNHRLPFGGVGESGMGAYHGRKGYDTFTHKKGVVKKGNWLDIPLRYAPYKGKLKQLKTMLKLFS